jgi:hypothetical protein
MSDHAEVDGGAVGHDDEGVLVEDQLALAIVLDELELAHAVASGRAESSFETGAISVASGISWAL